MNVIWKKVWRDVWERKGRTTQVVLSISIGIIAIGLTVGMRDSSKATVSTTTSTARLPAIEVGVGPGVTNKTIKAISRIPGVDAVEGSSYTSLQWKPDVDSQWHRAKLVMRSDYRHQQYEKLVLLYGAWPSNGGVVLESSSAKAFNISVGDTVYLEVSEKPKPVTITGIIYDFTATPPKFGGDSVLFVTRKDMERFGGPSFYTVVKAGLIEFDEQLAKDVGLAITDRFNRLDIDHGSAVITNPDDYFDAADGIFFLLIAMALFSMILSLFLVINTVTAIVSEQIPQIGVMKAIGAQSGQILRIFLSTIMVYILMSLVIAIPIGFIIANILTTWLMGLFNIEVHGYHISLMAISAQVALGVLLPLLAALWPIVTGARITVNEAISTYGLGTTIGVIEQHISSFQRLPRLLIITISSSLRHKNRLALTLAALVGAGAIFMMVLSVRGSMIHTFDEFLETYHFDVIIGFEKPQRVSTIEYVVNNIPNVQYAEMLEFVSGTPIRHIADRSGKEEVDSELIGVSKSGNAYRPVITAGRYLLPDDKNGIVLNEKLAQELNVSVGDQVVLRVKDKESTWTTVGLLFDINVDQTTALVWLTDLSSETHSRGQAGTLFIGMSTPEMADAELQTFAQSIKELFESQGKDVTFLFTAGEFRSVNVSLLMTIVYLLGAVAILMAIVGSIGLSGAISISALERRREIGVMRAIGALHYKIGMMFVGEGLLIGIISWVIAIPVSIPLGLIFTKAIGNSIELSLIYKYSISSIGLWLLIVIVLSTVSSGWPAWRTARLSVREVLSYY